MKITPLEDRVIVEPIEEQKKKGSILLPDTIEKEKPERGRVIAVGAGKLDDIGKLVKVPLKKGDIVYFNKYDLKTIKCTDVKGLEKEYLIGRMEKFLAVEE